MRYFTGQTIEGWVKASSANSFKELVDRHLTPIPLNITRNQYAEMTPKERDKAKQVPYLTPAAFNAQKCPRRTENATHCNLIFLDIDTAKDGTSPAAPLLANLDLIEQQMEPWSFCIYHTASSTPAAPRLRVMVDADAIPLDTYDDAARTIAKTLGLTKINSESMVPVQAMFLPSLFSDEDPEEYQPLILSNTDGRPFTTSDISSAANEVQTESRRKAGGAMSADGTLDPLDFLRAPLDNMPLSRVEEMLECVDPDIEYREWLEVATALKHQFAGTPEEEAAYQLFDLWSAKGTKYQGEDETRAKWDSFKPTPLNRQPVTIRSLMHRASLAGWDMSTAKDEQFRQTAAWLEGAPTLSKLLSEGLTRIITTPLLSQAEEEALLNQLCKEASRLGSKVSITALRKDMRLLRDKLKEKPTEKGKTNQPPWTRGVFYVASAEEFFRHSTGEKYTQRSWDAVYGKRLLPTEKQLIEAGLEANVANLSRPMLPANQFALNTVKIPSVWDYTYDPSSPNDLWVINQGKAFVNTYRRCHPHPNAAQSEEAGAIYMDHMRKLIAEEDYVLMLVDWMAYMVQVPGDKIQWAPLIQGAEGCGKSILGTTMSAVLGKPHVKSIGVQQIHSGFSEWATGAQLVIIEEVKVDGVRSTEVMNVLKPLISNDEVSVSQKFKDARLGLPNKTSYLLLTNHKDALPITPEDRRYCPVQSAIQTAQEVRALQQSGHFERYVEMVQNMAGGLRHWFENYPIRPSFNPKGSAPVTIYRKELVDDSASPAMAAVRRLISEGDHPLVQADLVSSKVIMELLEMERLKSITAQGLAGILRDSNYKTLGRHIIDDERHYLWVHCNAPERDYVGVARYRRAHDLINLEMEMVL
jgi:hypothetical protein